MKETTIVIKGKSDIDLLKRKKAMEAIRNLSTVELENLALLASSENARQYLSDPNKFAALKSFI